MNDNRNISVTSLGGGSAQARFLILLLAIKHKIRADLGVNLDINSIVTMADDGGSTGWFRRNYGGPALGDIINILVAVAGDPVWASTLAERYTKGELSGHKTGNVILDSMMRNAPGGLAEALVKLSQTVNAQVDVFPSTLQSPTLCVELQSGEVIRGEHSIDEKRDNGNIQIKRSWLEPEVQVYDAARVAIENSKLIALSAGDPYGSKGAVLNVKGVPEAIAQAQQNGALVISITSLFNRFGQSTGWSVSDHIRFDIDMLKPAKLDASFVDISEVSEATLAAYASEQEEKVVFDSQDIPDGVEIISGNFLDETLKAAQAGDFIYRSSAVARHGKDMIPTVEKFIIDRLLV